MSPRLGTPVEHDLSGARCPLGVDGSIRTVRPGATPSLSTQAQTPRQPGKHRQPEAFPHPRKATLQRSSKSRDLIQSHLTRQSPFALQRLNHHRFPGAKRPRPHLEMATKNNPDSSKSQANVSDNPFISIKAMTDSSSDFVR